MDIDNLQPIAITQSDRPGTYEITLDGKLTFTCSTTISPAISRVISGTNNRRKAQAYIETRIARTMIAWLQKYTPDELGVLREIL